MDRKFEKMLLDNKDEIVQMWMKEIESLKDKKYDDSISDNLFEDTNREFATIIFTSIEQKGKSIGIFVKFAEKIISLGWPLSYVTDGLQSFRYVAIDFVLSLSEELDSEGFRKLLRNGDTWIEPIIHRLVNEYSGNWEEIVSLQQIALQELSAPLIPVMDKITVMPLIGTIDTGRAKLIMENLLKGVIQHNAEVVLIDITGVPIVDTMVAHHIIQAAEAVRLIGSNCILVGIRPEIAQTIVSLGINLSEFSTKNSLKEGFTEALKITNREVVGLDAGEETITKMINSFRRE